MSQLKAYLEYKDSGIVWIGEIPSQWNTTKFKYYTEIKSGTNILQNELKDNGLYLVKGSNGPIGQTDAYNLEKKALLIGRVGAAGAIGLNNKDEKTWITDNVLICILSNINFNFAYYYLKVSNLPSLARKTAQPLITATQLKNVDITIPSKKEQKYISSFLDERTTEIDNLISDKERLIELLEEKRQAVITETVTKGLDSNVKMKDSGIEWIGDIPEHWEVKKIKYLIKTQKNSVKTGPFGSQLKNSDMEGKDIKVYNQRTVLDNNFESGNSYISKNKYRELKEFTIYPKDLLITTRGTIGSATIVPETIHLGILHPCLIRIQVNEKLIMLKYLLAYFNYTDLVVNQVKLMSNSTTIEVIYSNTLLNTRIILPPSIEEQKQIYNYIEEQNSWYTSLSNNIKNQISKLKEYRESLIYEAVTGKYDVRDYATKTEKTY